MSWSVAFLLGLAVGVAEAVGVVFVSAACSPPHAVRVRQAVARAAARVIRVFMLVPRGDVADAESFRSRRGCGGGVFKLCRDG
jgi:hypothetical protein